MSDSFSIPRRRLGQLAAHLVVALIALVVIGGATRVMEAGLACPDWPLCFGTLLPSKQMSLQVFLEWFHRLDAFLIGIALLIQFLISIIWRSRLPHWLPWSYAGLLALVFVQGGLGALTVTQLLPSTVVTAHLGLALLLLACLSALSEYLLNQSTNSAPVWWRLFGLFSLISVFIQSLLGGRMASSWASKSCLVGRESCQLLAIHQGGSVFVALSLLTFVLVSIAVGGWTRQQWPILSAVVALLFVQVGLGMLTIRIEFSNPAVTVGHQLVGALLVSLLSALSVRSPQPSDLMDSFVDQQSFTEPCHG